MILPLNFFLQSILFTLALAKHYCDLEFPQTTPLFSMTLRPALFLTCYIRRENWLELMFVAYSVSKAIKQALSISIDARLLTVGIKSYYPNFSLDSMKTSSTQNVFNSTSLFVISSIGAPFIPSILEQRQHTITVRRESKCCNIQEYMEQ